MKESVVVVLQHVWEYQIAVLLTWTAELILFSDLVVVHENPLLCVGAA